jgi:hypothetical protein
VTVAEAARQWEEAKRAIAENEPLLKAAAEVLKEHFRKTERHTYKDTIGYSTSTRKVLDQAMVKEELGDRLPRFMREQQVESLTLLSR